MPSIVDAIQLALEVHRSQVDKAGEPYILHPLRVMGRFTAEQERMVAVLHDVVEDSRPPNRYTVEDLARLGYPEAVVEAVDCLSRRKESGESYGRFIERIKLNPLARRVKIADLEDNMDVRRLAAVGFKDSLRLKEYLKSWRELTRLEGLRAED